MGITLGSNIASARAVTRLDSVGKSLSQTFERLSSGLRINKASDDAAGLSIADSLNLDNRVFTQAIRNINDGVSYLSIADSALEQLSGITQRQLELAEQAANGTLGGKQRVALQRESDSLTDEYTRILSVASFNGRQIFQSGSALPELSIQLGYGTQGALGVTLGAQGLRNVGDGTFTSQDIASSQLYRPQETIRADFNGDGILDFAAVGQFLNSAANGLEIQLGNGDGSFQSSYSWFIAGGPSVVSNGRSIGDFDGDGVQDLAVLGDDGTNNVLLAFRGQGNGVFSLTASIGIPVAAGLTMVDTDRDGKSEFVVIGNSGPGYVYKYQGGSTFSQSATFTADAAWSNAVGMVTDDFNNDGIKDIAWTAGNLNIAYGTGAGSFSPARSFAGTLGGNAKLIVADFNRDGNLDFGAAGIGASQVSLFFGNADGTVGAESKLTTGSIANSLGTLTKGDINGDGYQDILAAGSSNAVLYLLGNGDGTFQGVRSQAAPYTFMGGIATGDFNADGVEEILLGGDPTSGTTRKFFNQGITRSTTGVRVTLSRQQDARDGLADLRKQLDRINLERGVIGSFESRLGSASSAIYSQRDNSIEAESRIRSADVAEESANLTRQKILQQAAAAVLAQANNQPGIALRLLNGS